MKIFAIAFMFCLTSVAYAQDTINITLSQADANFFYPKFLTLGGVWTRDPDDTLGALQVVNFTTANGAFNLNCKSKFSQGLEVGPRSCQLAFDRSKSDLVGTYIGNTAVGNGISANLYNVADLRSFLPVLGMPPLGGATLLAGVDTVSVEYSNGTFQMPKVQVRCDTRVCSVIVLGVNPSH